MGRVNEDSLVRSLVLHEDERGSLFEVLRADQTDHDIKQIYFAISKPGASRGNHYHTRKIEWFCVTKGVGKLVLKHTVSLVEEEIILMGQNPTICEIRPNISHSIINMGQDDMHLVVIANEVFDPNDADTFYEDL